MAKRKILQFQPWGSFKEDYVEISGQIFYELMNLNRRKLPEAVEAAVEVNVGWVVLFLEFINALAIKTMKMLGHLF